MIVRRNLTYENVISTLAVFLLLAGGTAFAANQLAKKSVGAKQLKANAVTTAKIKKNAVTAAKIKAGAVDGTKIKDGSVTGAEINAPSTPFSQVVARIRGATGVSLGVGQLLQLDPYTQAAGEDAIYLAYLDVNFPAGCEQPREAEAFLMEDPVNPSEPYPDDVVATASVEDKSSGAVTKRAEFSPLSFLGQGAMSDLAPAVATAHTFEIYISAANCNSGGGITSAGAGLDVIGTR